MMLCTISTGTTCHATTLLARTFADSFASFLGVGFQPLRAWISSTARTHFAFPSFHGCFYILYDFIFFIKSKSNIFEPHIQRQPNSQRKITCHPGHFRTPKCEWCVNFFSKIRIDAKIAPNSYGCLTITCQIYLSWHVFTIRSQWIKVTPCDWLIKQSWPRF